MNKVVFMLSSLQERLKAIREFKGWSQQEFADFMDVPQSNYARYERGITEPQHSFLAKISRELGISSDWLLLGHGEMFGKIFIRNDLCDRVKSVRHFNRMKREEFAEKGAPYCQLPDFKGWPTLLALKS
jgi:transcriptional regulator with XRE-family HTH domain